MAARAICGTLVVAFALVIGHVAWNLFAGTSTPEYLVGGDNTVLTGTDPTAKNLYLRRTLYLPQHPRHAWLQAVARDDLRLYVNGRFVQGSKLDGHPVAVLVDLTPHLHKGANAIGLAVRQNSVGHPPGVALQGGFTLSDGEHILGPDAQWRCNSSFDRRGQWWFDAEFPDKYWPSASANPGNLFGKVRQPPRSVTTPPNGRWISPPELYDNRAVVQRTFDVSGRCSECWVRVTVTGAYRLGLNGVLLDQQEDQLGALVPALPAQRTYDLTPYIQRGRNAIALMLTQTSEPVHVLADLEITDGSGRRIFGSDEHWLSRPGAPADWLAGPPGDAARHPCLVESGDPDMEPRFIRRDFVQIAPPAAVAVRQGLQELALIIVLGLLTVFACRLAARRIARQRVGLALGSRQLPAVYLALALPTVALAAAMLAVYDPRVARQDVYQFSWLALAIAAVPFQWALMALWPKRAGFDESRQDERPGDAEPPAPTGPRRAARWATGLGAIALMAAGFLLRLPGIERDSLHWDEVENMETVVGVFERGFPSRTVHPDMPTAYAHTSELFFYPPALARLVFHDDRWVIRFPGVCWSTAAIGLIYLAGRRMFRPTVGLVAAALLSLSPFCIAMCSFGRYFAQLQFFALLTVYAYWLTLRGVGPIHRGALWLTAISFIAMFLTWEAAALMAPAMIVAAILMRRGRLATVLTNSSVWAALLVVGMAIVLQFSHVTLQQTQFLWYGTSHSDVSLKPMWRYPFFQPWYYVWQSSWNQDALIPMAALVGAVTLALRHRWRHSVRFLLIIHLGTCLLMALTLTASAWRYIHHQIPLLILLASAAFVACGQALVALARRGETPAPIHWFARAVATAVVLAMVAVGSGQTLQLPEMSQFRVEGYNPDVFRFPDLEEPARYVSSHMRKGDLVLATDPFQVNYMMARVGRPDCRVDFWLASNLRHPATLDDHRSLPLDRRDGTPMVPDWESLRDLFNRHDRIWYVVQPVRHWDQNVPEVTAYLLQHMEVAYEDFDALVLLRDNHRPAEARRRDDQTLRRAQARYLP